MITSITSPTRSQRDQNGVSRIKTWSLPSNLNQHNRLGRCVAFVVALSIGLLSCEPAAGGPPSDGPLVYASERIDFSAAKPVRRKTKRSVSPNRQRESSAQSTRSQVTAFETYPEADGPIRQASYVDPAADWGGHYNEVSCGCEGPCDCSYDCEPGCGLEISCGIENWDSCGCGVGGCATAGCDGCCDGMDPSCGCDSCCGRGCTVGDWFPRLKFGWYEMDLFAGVAGFTGPMNFADTNLLGTDRDGAASFGFYEGFNRGRPLDFLGTDLAAQCGVRFTQANLSGAEFSDDTRQQVFLTAGFFRRVDCGLQYGLVYDYMYEDWYYKAYLGQLRGELSWVFSNVHTYGFRFASGVKDDEARTSVINDAGVTIGNDIAMEAINQYRLFHRRNLARCGTCEAFAGWTDNDDALLGVDLNFPLNRTVLWNTSATYMVPNEGTGGHLQEGWNLAIGLTYRPCGVRTRWRHNLPLFNVADNGSMLIDLR